MTKCAEFEKKCKHFDEFTNIWTKHVKNDELIIILEKPSILDENNCFHKIK